jgi:hypothetical protein
MHVPENIPKKKIKIHFFIIHVKAVYTYQALGLWVKPKFMSAGARASPYSTEKKFLLNLNTVKNIFFIQILYFLKPHTPYVSAPSRVVECRRQCQILTS